MKIESLKDGKRCLLIASVVFVFSCHATQASISDTLKTLKPKPKYQKEMAILVDVLDKYHYLKLAINDSLSSVVFQNYLEALDPNKVYFTQSDIDYFSKYEYQLDDDLKAKNLDVAFQIFRILRERANTRVDYVQQLTQREFDYAKDEVLDVSDDSVVWATSHKQMDERWRKMIKSQILFLKLAGKDEKRAKEVMEKRYRRLRKSINQYDSEDVFQLYMNALTESYDPHTNYFSPISAENFNMNMNLSFEGIGARLSQEMDYTVIYEVIPGGPAYKNKQLQKDDKIIGVAQGDTDFVDVVGWRLKDVVQLIRGPKGSTVRLQYLKGDGTNDMVNEVSLLREKIKMEEQSAKAETIPIKHGEQTFNLGVITLPGFYMDFEAVNRGEADYTSASRDIEKLIVKLKEETVDGILIDLRYNGGGSLPEAIRLTGLFIDEGPVVQVKDYHGKISVKRDIESGVLYDGPLVVLVNRFSASASEIFSAAIQDYKRGIVVGETTFGKGTVQQMISFNRYYPDYPEKLGNLKFTLSKFYRVNGSSTQNIGVTPDIQFSSAFPASEFGESARANALKWDKIPSSYFIPTNTVWTQMLDSLRSIYQNDLRTDVDLQNMEKAIARAKENQKKKTLSLNYEIRRAEAEEQKRMERAQKKVSESAEVLYPGYTVDKKEDEKLRKDPELKESLKLLLLWVENTKTPELAVSKK